MKPEGLCTLQEAMEAGMLKLDLQKMTPGRRLGYWYDRRPELMSAILSRPFFRRLYYWLSRWQLRHPVTAAEAVERFDKESYESEPLPPDCPEELREILQVVLGSQFCAWARRAVKLSGCALKE